MHLQPSSRQGELIALARRLACERFAPRADRHDCAASFPFDDYGSDRWLYRCGSRRGDHSATATAILNGSRERHHHRI